MPLFVFSTLADFTFISRPPPIGSLLSGTTYVCVPHTHTQTHRHTDNAPMRAVCERAEENRAEQRARAIAIAIAHSQ